MGDEDVDDRVVGLEEAGLLAANISSKVSRLTPAASITSATVVAS